jgi:hypothetical protein
MKASRITANTRSPYRLRTMLWALASLSLFSSMAAETDTITYDELARFSSTEQKLHPKAPTLLSLVIRQYGRRDSYPISEINSARSSSQSETPADANYTPPTQVKPRPIEGWDVVTHALLHPKLRHDYTDVLPAEDPSQQNLSTGKFSDLSGATFSYAWDGKAHTDTWSAEAALIVPMIWSGNLDYGLKPIYYGIVPSVSLNRVTTNGDSKNDMDSLIYRAGVFAQWLLAGSPGQAFHARLNFRGSFTYATDTRGDLQLPAGEFDFEPQVFGGPTSSLGYIGEILYDPNRPYNDPKRVTIGYQLRAWLHGEYGSVQRESEQVALGRNDFFRLGPTAQLRLLFPTFFQGLTLSAEYHYLPTLSGPGGHDSLFKAGAELTIVDHSQTSGPRLTLTANYADGGMDLTKEDVKTFTAGLGVLF